MKLRTEIRKPRLNLDLDHTKKGLSLVSCFADNMAQKLIRLGYGMCVNPFGTLYNPASICSVLERLGDRRAFVEKELFLHNNLWHSELHHGDFSSEDKESALENINQHYSDACKSLDESDYAIITLGSAWIYKNALSGQVVSNCHKRPASDFIRERLSVVKIVDMFTQAFNSTLKDKYIILTVSPVRHIKDGLIENSLSKATLILAAHTLAEKFPNRVEYFPSYEIVNDDLRDYRFYKSDMCHPSDQAVDYVWDIFSKAVFSLPTTQLNKQLEVLAQASEHRAINAHSENHKKFCLSMIERINMLKNQYPSLDLSSWEKYFASF